MIRVRKFENYLKEAFGENAAFFPFSNDVYTRLPHKAIGQSVRFILDKVSSSRRRDSVIVPNERRESCLFGKASNKHESKTAKFCDILEFMNFDLDNSYFTLGDTILKQRQGTPIGGILSTSMACLCAFDRNSNFTIR